MPRVMWGSVVAVGQAEGKERTDLVAKGKMEEKAEEKAAAKVKVAKAGRRAIFRRSILSDCGDDQRQTFEDSVL